MSLEINVQDLLKEYHGGFEIDLSEKLDRNYFSDFELLEDEINIAGKVVRITDGVEFIIEDFSTNIKYKGNDYKISLSEVSREYHVKKILEDTDDIMYIEKNCINIEEMIRQEVILSLPMEALI